MAIFAPVCKNAYDAREFSRTNDELDGMEAHPPIYHCMLNTPSLNKLIE